MRNNLFKTIGLMFWVLVSFAAHSATVKIGNSNTGGDLEKLTPIVDGPIKEAQAAALELILKLNVAGIPGLGGLKSEIEKSDLFINAEDIKAIAQDDFRPDHLAPTGHVYARTMPETYAPTRFFPVALTLSKDQLVRLHIHEALHRALPEGLREDESIVVQMGLAMNSPDATYDSVLAESQRLIPAPTKEISYKENLYPSQFSYGVRQFMGVGDNLFSLKRAHLLRSYLYPFGSQNNTVGVGIDFQMIEKGSEFQSGPITLSARWNLLTRKLFTFDLFGSASLNTLSFQELKNSPYGRDIYEIGFTIRKEFDHVYFANSLSYKSGSLASQTIQFVTYNYDFGEVVEPSIHAGAIFGSFQGGIKMSMYLADRLSITGGSFSETKGRFRLVTIGPELSYKMGSFFVSGTGRFLLDSTTDANLSTMGMINDWVGRGGFELGVGYRY
jgi:hypothetical protein